MLEKKEHESLQANEEGESTDSGGLGREGVWGQVRFDLEEK